MTEPVIGLGPSIVQALGVIAAAGVSFVGARRGARKELNGTAVAVREIKREVREVKEAQEEHIRSVAQEFKEARQHRAELHDRVATTEGYLEALTEQRVATKRAARAKKQTRARRKQDGDA